MKPQNPKSLPCTTISAATLLACAGFLVSCSGTGAPDPAEHRREEPSEFYLYLPRGFGPDRRWPVFVGVHGEGGTGLDCWRLWQPYADQEGFVLVCPSLADGNGGWYQSEGDARLLAILDDLYREYSTRPQVFLAGFSAGGQFVQGFAFQYPSYVMAVSVIAPGSIYLPTDQASRVPFLVIVGDRDDPLRVQGARDLVARLELQGYPVSLEVLPATGHEVTRQARDGTLAFFREQVGR